MNAYEMFGAARWVSPCGECDTPYIRGEFSLGKKIKSAEITICGLGFFELYLNGQRVSDEKFNPVNSDFHFYPDQHCYKVYGEVTSHRIYAVKYDVKDFLTEENCIGVLLAPGWYKNEYCAPYGEVKLCFRLDVTYENGEKAEILSGDWLKWAQSPITKYSFHHGETQDFASVRLEGWNKVGYKGGEWHDLTLIDAPDTNYYVQDCPSDKIIRRLKATFVGETEEGYIYDAG
ncbi:MAG: alpha-L-rhamnosidase N-terminal domain-containing protein, partial [Clostridia bacterium]|nr:alpha-L-rhamnosidase N-terminal domain-containing protein [Clostridia bacterium]